MWVYKYLQFLKAPTNGVLYQSNKHMPHCFKQYDDTIWSLVRKTINKLSDASTHKNEDLKNMKRN